MSTWSAACLLNREEDILPQVLCFISIDEMYHIMRLVNKKWNDCILNFRVIRSLYAYSFRRGGTFSSLLSTLKNNSEFDSTATDDSSLSKNKQAENFNTNTTSSELSSDTASMASCVVWDKEQFECILGCLKGHKERKPLSKTFSNNTFTITSRRTHSENSSAPVLTAMDCEKRATFVIQFIFSVIYDYKFQPHTGPSDIGDILNLLKERLSNAGDTIPCLLNMLPVACEYFGSNISLLMYKLFERLLTLDVENFSHWSLYFPNMKYAAPIRSPEHLNYEIRVKLFNMELDLLLDIISSMILGGMSSTIYTELLQFACYCSQFIIPTLTKMDLPLAATCKEKCEYIQNIIIKQEKNRYFLMNPFSHLSENVDQNKLIFQNNPHVKNFSELQQNNLLLNPQFTYKTLSLHVAAMLDYGMRQLSISDFLSVREPYEKRSKVLLRNCSCWNNLLNFLTTCIVQENDLNNRASIYEKIEQAMLYSFVLNDFSSAKLFQTVIENGAVHRMKRTINAQKKSNDYELLLKDCKGLSPLTRQVSLTDLVFLFDGSSDIRYHLYHITPTLREMGRIYFRPSILYHYLGGLEMSSNEEDEIEHKIQIISKKSLKDKLKSMFKQTSQNESNSRLDIEILEFLYFVVQQRKKMSDEEIYKMSITAEQREVNK
ncbi:hypothetical protein FDP41_012064 [Naegleria fowleri]|uniref:Ras-GEF domain-containing protein n=1 Tax=Naegleria fowleri TaxID=5763 RepID=A0A6A5BVV6_NAEFO|nr:uncharacterized protein FDP41_012064 [Naegleria fowleri]KAF0982203.1 hypothetical protein FDP41_012064 [Naegleria fowleri]